DLGGEPRRRAAAGVPRCAGPSGGGRRGPGRRARDGDRGEFAVVFPRQHGPHPRESGGASAGGRPVTAPVIDQITALDVDALATGASLLGCGGGGPTLVGRMLCRAALGTRPVAVTTAAALPP